MIGHSRMLFAALVGLSLALTGCPPKEEKPAKPAAAKPAPAAKPGATAKAPAPAKPTPVTSTGGGLRNVGATVSPAPPPAPARGPLLDAGMLLTLKDIQDTTGYQGQLTEKDLAGIPRSSSYDSNQFKPADASISIGITVQAWTFTKVDDAIREYQRHLKSYPDVKEADEIGNKSFRAVRSGTQYINWLDQGHLTVISLTCNEKICDWDKLVKMANLIASRVPNLKPADAKPAAPAPAAPAPAPAAPPTTP